MTAAYKIGLFVAAGFLLAVVIYYASRGGSDAPDTPTDLADVSTAQPSPEPSSPAPASPPTLRDRPAQPTPTAPSPPPRPADLGSLTLGPSSANTNTNLSPSPSRSTSGATNPSPNNSLYTPYDPFNRTSADRGESASSGTQASAVGPGVSTSAPPQPVRLPRRPANPAPAGGDGELDPGVYVIEPGDLLPNIARTLYGDSKYWVAISKANPTLDPTRMAVGQVIRLPTQAQLDAIDGTDAAQLPEPGMTLAHTVTSGDSLSTISQRYYGSAKHWRFIYNANRAKIGDNPDRLRAGATIDIPPLPVSK